MPDAVISNDALAALIDRDGKGAAWAERRRFGPRHAPEESDRKLGLILESSEKSVFELGRQNGLDHYWRAYFWLLPR